MSAATDRAAVDFGLISDGGLEASTVHVSGELVRPIIGRRCDLANGHLAAGTAYRAILQLGLFEPALQQMGSYPPDSVGADFARCARPRRLPSPCCGSLYVPVE